MDGEIIKRELEKAKISQKELAEAIFVTPQAVSKWINNQSQPTRDNVEAISDFLKINLEEKLFANKRRNKKIMKQEHESIENIDTIEKAEKEAVLILDEYRIEDHYPYSTYLLLKWFITAIFGLTYHNYLNHNFKDKDENGYDYDYAYCYMEDYFESSEKSGCDSLLDFEFFEMGGDLFESWGEYTLKNHDYCEESMNLWYKFKKAISNDEASKFRVALVEISR